MATAGKQPFHPTHPYPHRATDLGTLTLDDHGMIRRCGAACEQLFGYRPDELAGRHVSTLLPQLDAVELVQDDRINSRLAYLCHCAIPFHARHRDCHSFLAELFVNRLDRHNVAVLVRPLEPAPAAGL